MHILNLTILKCIVTKQRFESFASGARQLYFLVVVMLGIVFTITNAIHTTSSETMNISEDTYVEVKEKFAQ